jgi:hypothetical protein
VTLSVKSADEATEIRVFDGRLRQVSRGLGTLKTDLPPGIYKVLADTGGTRYEEKILLGVDEKQKERTVKVPALKYNTPVPVKGGGGDASSAAANEARGRNKVALSANPSSSLFFFISACPHKAGNKGEAPKSLADGLSLCTADGKELVDLGKKCASNRGGEPWAAVTVLLDPGYYRLRLRLSGGDSVEQCLFAPRDWCTQIFMHTGESAVNCREQTLDLASTSILMKEYSDPKFDPADPDVRLADLARSGLSRGRQVLSDAALKEIILGKLRDPMLGLYGAHLLLLADPPDPVTGDLKGVDGHLAKIFGFNVTFAQIVHRIKSFHGMAEHPDVQALELLLPDAHRPAGTFTNPPMFRQSWRPVVRASYRDPKVVPNGCLSQDIALRVLNEGVWLLWRNSAPDKATQEQKQLTASYQAAVANILLRKAEKSKGGAAKGPDEPGSFDSAEAGSILAEMPDVKRLVSGALDVKNADRQAIARTLGIPLSNVKELLSDLITQHPDSRARPAASPAAPPPPK